MSETTANGEADAADRAAIKSIISEAQKRAQDHFKRAKSWEKANYGIGIPAALLAGTAGVAALSDISDDWQFVAAVLALVGGGLTGIVTTLNAGRKSEMAWSAEASLRAICREATLLDQLDRDRFSREEMREAIDDLVTWMNEVEGLAPRPSPYRRWLGQRRDRAGT
jgi:hypothetical protein